MGKDAAFHALIYSQLEDNIYLRYIQLIQKFIVNPFIL